MNCTKCDKNMTVETSQGLVSIGALQIKVSWEDDKEPELAELIKQNLGKYMPSYSDVEEIQVDLCYECWIDSLLGTATGLDERSARVLQSAIMKKIRG